MKTLPDTRDPQKHEAIPARIRRAADRRIAAMTASDPNYQYGPETYEDFAGTIHGLVCDTQAGGAEAAEYQSRRLREILGGRGIPCPESGSFLYFGGRTFPIPYLFATDGERSQAACAMARDIVDRVDTVDSCTVEQVTDALAESAALDDEMLTMRTAAMVPLLNKEHPECGVTEYFGNFTILPDGSLLSLHYLYAD